MGGLNILLLLAGAGALYLWNLSRAAGNLTFFPGSITGLSLSGTSPVITCELIVQNTSNVSFTINSMVASVYADDTLIGNISNFTPVAINGNSQGTIPLTLELLSISIVNDIIGIITGGVGKQVITVRGTVNANGIQSGFSLQYKMGV